MKPWVLSLTTSKEVFKAGNLRVGAAGMGFGKPAGRGASQEIALGYKKIQVDSGTKGEWIVCVSEKSEWHGQEKRGEKSKPRPLPTPSWLTWRPPCDLKKTLSRR